MSRNNQRMKATHKNNGPGRSAPKARQTKKRVWIKSLLQTQSQYFDFSLLACIVILSCFGLVMLYSTSAYSAQTKYGNAMHFFTRQALFTLVSFAGMFVVSLFNRYIYAAAAKYVFLLSIFLMILVRTPLGIEVYGARRWIRLPFDQQLQPAEVAKIGVILFIPFIICRVGKNIVKKEGIVDAAIPGFFSALCIFFLTENLSSAIIVAGITIFMIFVSYPKHTKRILAIGSATLVLGYLAARLFALQMAASSDFRIKRIITWVNPEKFSGDEGFQTLQALYAIGSGGFFGKGLGSSAQKLIIPEVQNDMILSVICEELGVFGVIVILVLFGFLLYRLMFIAKNAPDEYSSLVMVGIFAHISIQVVLNIAVVTNTIPNTGITLPFVSYGGTSVIFLMAEMGVALGISRSIKLQE